MMKKSILSLLLALVLALSLGTTALAGGEGVTIGVVQYVQHVALDSACEGFLAALAENGYESATVDVQNAQGDSANLSTIADQFIGNNVDLVLAIATPAAQTMAGKTESIPILGTAITDYATAKLVVSNEAPGYNVSGTTDMNPIQEQIDLLVRLVPEAKTVGVLYTSSEDNSILQASIAKECIEALGMTYVERTVSSQNDVQQATQDIVGLCDAIYIPTDNVFAASMPIVYGVTVESKTPVICGESGMVVGGGLATLGINYYNLGYQTGLMAIRVLEGADVSTMPIESSTDFDYTINGAVAAEIGIEIPEDLLPYVMTAE